MRSKGLILFFIIALTVVSLYQYLLTIPTSNLEAKAKEYANEQVAKNPGASWQQGYAAYLDKTSSDTIFSIPMIKSYTYNDLKKSQLALGLDLKGGMSVLLQVDLKDFLKTVSGDNQDPAFLDAMNKATAAQVNSQKDFVTLFVESYRESSKGAPLANLFARSNLMKDRISFSSTDAEVSAELRSLANTTVNETYKRLKDRIDKLGVVQPNVQLDAARDLILVELPGIDNPERARAMLTGAAKLEFWKTYRAMDNFGGKQIIELIVDADKQLQAIATGDSSALKQPEMRKDTSYTFATDSLGNVDSTQKKMVVKDVPNEPEFKAGPILSKLSLFPPQQKGATFGVVSKGDRDSLTALLSRPSVKNLFPPDLEFRFSNKEEAGGKYSVFAIKKNRGSNDAPLDGSVVTKASEQLDPRRNDVQVSVSMNNDGARKWAELTTEASNGGNREIAITLDDEVVSAPSVNEPITGGSSSITGNFSLEEARDFAAILQVGKLPAKAIIKNENQVGPSLGQENINKSLFTMLLSLGLLCAFMWLYYAKGGIISIIALVANLFFLIATLANFGTVMTLPGIAGIVLILAAAVDANVIIYERIREELRSGMDHVKAITVGFKRALPAILDANVTTMLTALVLMYFGLGPIKGFGTVLVVGILTSLLTAVLISRLITEWWISKGKHISYSMPWSENVMTNVNIDWMGMRKYAYMFSAVLMLIALGAIFTRGFEFGVDFKGGNSYNVQFDKPMDLEALKASLTTAFEGNVPVVKAVNTNNTYNITTSYKIDDQSPEAINKVVAKLHEGVVNVAGNVDLEKFKNTSSTGVHITSSSQVGPTVADDIRTSSIKSGLWALALIFIFLLIRFRRWQFSLGAVLSLFHDVLITLGLFALLHGLVPFSLEVDQAIIACILTVIGLSVNDTVIVFDRIREFVRTYAGKPKEEVFNMAINSTLSRTLITSGTIILVSLLLFLFGGSATKGFSFGMLMGIFLGTYSSVYIASALVVDLTKEKSLTELDSILPNVDKKPGAAEAKKNKAVTAK